MAHFARIDSNKRVQEVIVIRNEDAPDEATGKAFISSIGLEGEWLQCSYNTRKGVHQLGGTPFRGNYPGHGWRYDEELDAFIEDLHKEDQVFNAKTYSWENAENTAEPTA